MSGPNKKVGGEAVTTTVQDNPSIAFVKQHLALEEALQNAKDESSEHGMSSELTICEIQMNKYKAEKCVIKQEQRTVDGKRKRVLQYEAAGEEIDAKRNKHREEELSQQTKEDKERKEEFEQEEKYMEEWAKEQRDAAGRHVTEYAEELVDHGKRTKEKNIKLLELERSAQFDVDHHRDATILQWAEDRRKRIAWGTYQKEKKGQDVVDIEEDQDSTVEESEYIEGLADYKRSKEPKSKVKSSNKGEQANHLTLDDRVHDVDGLDNEQPPSERRAVVKANASRKR